MDPKYFTTDLFIEPSLFLSDRYKVSLFPTTLPNEELDHGIIHTELYIQGLSFLCDWPMD